MSLDRDLDLISNVSFFAGIPAEALKLIAFSADPRDFADRARLFSSGEIAEGGLLIIEGRVDLVDERANPPKVVDRLGPGSLIGELALITETRRPVSGIANGPVRALFVRRALFRRMLEGYPDIAALLEGRIAERLTKLSPQIGRIGEKLAAIDEA